MVVAVVGVVAVAVVLVAVQHRFPKSPGHWALALAAAGASLLGWWGLFLLVGWHEVHDYGLDRFAGKLLCLGAGVYGATAALVLALTSDRPAARSVLPRR